MERILINAGLFGRTFGQPVACLRAWAAMLGANGRSLPLGGET